MVKGDAAHKDACIARRTLHAAMIPRMIRTCRLGLAKTSHDDTLRQTVSTTIHRSTRPCPNAGLCGLDMFLSSPSIRPIVERGLKLPSCGSWSAVTKTGKMVVFDAQTWLFSMLVCSDLSLNSFLTVNYMSRLSYRSTQTRSYMDSSRHTMRPQN